MKITVKKGLDIPELVNNKYVYKCLRIIVRGELTQIDILTSMLEDDLTDEEYLEKARNIYQIDLDSESELEGLAKRVRTATKSRLESDRKAIKDNLKEKIEHLKRWTEESRKLTRERLIVEEQVTGYCDTLLNMIDKRKEKVQK